MVSLINIGKAGLIAKSAAVSNEEMVGINAVFNHNITSNFVITQTECIAIAVTLDTTRQKFNRSGKLRVLLSFKTRFVLLFAIVMANYDRSVTSST